MNRILFTSIFFALFFFNNISAIGNPGSESNNSGLHIDEDKLTKLVDTLPLMEQNSFIEFQRQISTKGNAEKIVIYQQLAKSLAIEKKPNLSNEAFNLALKLVPKSENNRRAQMLYDKASMLFDLLHKNQIIEFYNMALQERPTLGSQLEAMIYMKRGRAFYESGEYKLAMQDYLFAKHYFESNNILNQDYGHLLHFIGSVFKRQNNDQEALRYYLSQIEVGKKINNPILEAEGYYLSADIYNVMGEEEKDLEYSLKALRIFVEQGAFGMVQMMYTNIAHYYLGLKNFDTAKAYLDSARFVQIIHPSHQDELVSLFRYYAKYYSKKGNYTKAIAYTDSALAEAGKSTSNKKLLLGDVFRTKAWVQYDFGHYKEAFDDLDEYHYYWEEMITEENIKTVHDMEAKYEGEKKKKEIELLNKDKILNQLALKTARQRNLFLIIGLSIVVGFGLLLLNRFQVIRKQKKIIEKEKKRSDELLLNILPEEVAEELKETGAAKAKLIDEVTVLFTDFKGFTAHSAQLSPQKVVEEINECFVAFDHIMDKYNIEKIKTIGDSYMAAGGLPTPNTTHVEDVIRAALEIQEFIVAKLEERTKLGQSFFEVRIGVHTGPVVAGIVGIKKFAYDIWGDTVNTASRMESNGAPGKVNISESTYNLIKNNPAFVCEPRGKVQAKGKGELEMYFVSKV